ncbi:YdcF family protein [candidate division WS5 bacterium]|uniref:YdcF family protein n=1 Tax=candidate division WS5 bacterium TaxID=2093353 RepID=A0A419DG77_9BACT|nr:MAG: YdcF family protein [candidate division WS5 bacterium]
MKIFKKLFKLAIVLVVLAAVLLLGASLYLSPQDKLEHADAITVISGGDTDARINEGVALYMDGFSDRIIFSGAAAEGEVSNASAMKNIAIRKGVPAKAILIEEDSKTTEENAIDVARIIKDEEIKSIILVTSPYHQRRAYEAFRDALGKDFRIINHSAKDSRWRKADWWSNSEARFLTLGEIMKNLYALINP